jgi:uncharacterized protein involved in response to NO
LFAALSVPLWALQYSGIIVPLFPGPAWHAHEMLFGFTMAVVAGFLFTAVRNWTQRPTPTGAALAAIVALWIAGRVLVLVPLPLAAGIANVLFPVAVAVGIGVPLVASGNRRNYFFVALMAALSIAVLLFHLSAAGIVGWPARSSLYAGLDIVLFMVAVIGGRVIPMFTNNGVPGAQATRNPWIERAALGSVLAVLALDLFGIDGVPLAIVAGAAALAHAARLRLWNPWRARRTPLVWVLHAAYGWIAVHFVLRALAQWSIVAEPLAVHALTIGVIGGMVIGMMTRTALGHTGRPLAADRWEVACYALVQLAAIARVAGGIALPSAYLSMVWVSGLCWSAAFALYFVRYWPILTRARLDGMPG